MRPYRLAVAASLLLLLFSCAVIGSWFWARQALEEGIAKWRAEQIERGFDVSYQGPVFSGFPFALSVAFNEPAVTTPQELIWRGPPIHGEAKLWDPFTINLRFPGLHRLRLPEELDRKAADLSTEEARGRVVLQPDGQVEMASIDLEALLLHGPEIETVSVQRLTARLGPLRRGGGDMLDEIDLVGEVLFLDLPAGKGGLLGNQVARLSFDTTLIGGIPAGKPEDALPAWRDSGGRWRFHKLIALWGPLDLQAEGRLTLDEELRPAGLLEADLKGAGRIIERLIDDGKIKPGAALAAQLALAAMSRTDEKTGETVLSAPISLRGGLLYLGPLPLFPVAPVL